MEEIEYLEEYEDLVLPALNSAAAAAAASSASFQINNSPQNQKITDDADDSSSSLDQDIFNCLFDDNSDDEFNEYQNSGGKVIEQVEILRQEPSQLNTIPKAVNKTVTSQAPKVKTFIAKTSGTAVPLKARPETAIVNKTKSIATVRPTVQNQQQQNILQKKSNLLQTPSTSSFIQQQNQSTCAKSSHLQALSRKPISSTTSFSSASLISKNPAVSSLSTAKSTTDPKKVIAKRAATIVKPEKIIIKDPVNDPLDLDNLSEVESDNYSLSDISGETYNTISEFEDDSNDDFYSGDDDYYYEEEYDEDNISSSSQVIELSNDSSAAPSNLEDLRASTPSPVISEDSYTPSGPSGFKISTTKFVKPYSHPDVIESVLIKGEKPKLLELLHKYNLLDDSVENDEGENTVIDITTSRENLVENIDTEQVAIVKETPAVETITIDTVNSNPADNDKSLTSNPLNKKQTKNSKKTNKNKSNKKSVTNMDTTNDYIDIKSPDDISTDSDLSAVEELLEESYAEAMKKVQDVPSANQEVGYEMEIRGREVVPTIVESEEKLPKDGVVINYNNIHVEMDDKKTDENEEHVTTENMEVEKKQTDQHKDLKESEKLSKTEIKEKEENNDMETSKQPESIDCSLEQEGIVIVNADNDQHKDLEESEKLSKTEVKEKEESNDMETSKQPESINCSVEQEGIVIVNADNDQHKDLKESEKLSKTEVKEKEENKDMETSKQPESIDCSLKQEEIVIVNADNDADKEVKATSSQCQETAKIFNSVDISTCNNSPNARKKKRFRNLLTPEPTSSETAKNIDEIQDFKGFEEDEKSKSDEFVAKIDIEKRNEKNVVESQESELQIENISENDRTPGSFKSPNSHQSYKDKSKESKRKSSIDNSKESRDKNSKQSKTNKSSSSKDRDSSTDRRSRESSRDKKSRESSKDRSRESSKDRSKHDHIRQSNKDSSSKHYHRDHRKSSDSKDSSKSRESSKSGSSKETKATKTNTLDSQKSSSLKNDSPPDIMEQKSTEKMDKKTSAITNNPVKEIIKSSSDSKKDLREHKNSLEKKDKRPAEAKEKHVSKSLAPNAQESKQNILKDDRKTYPSSTKNDSNMSTTSLECKQNMFKDDSKSSSSSMKIDSNINRNSSKERTNITKTIDLTKSSNETKKTDHSKNPKTSGDLNKSLANKPSTPADNVKTSKTNTKPIEVPKSVQSNKNTEKILQKPNVSTVESKSVKKITKALNDKSLSSKDTPEKKTMQNPKTSSTNMNTSKITTKNIEGDKKDPPKIINDPNSGSKINKTDDQTKKDIANINKTSTERKESNKTLPKSDGPCETKQQTPIKQMSKETVATSSSKKIHEGSSTKPCKSEAIDISTKKSTSETIKKIKPIAKSSEIKSKEKSAGLKKPKEIIGNNKESERGKIAEIKNKEQKNNSMSPNRPESKEEALQKPEATNTNNTTKDSKKLDEVTAKKTEKTKSDEIKIEGTVVTTDINKTKHSKVTADSIKGPDKYTNNEEKNIRPNSNNNVKEANKNETHNVEADDKNVKNTKTNKDELNIVKSNENESKKNDALKIIPLEPEAEKTNVLESCNKEQQGNEQKTHIIEKTESSKDEKPIKNTTNKKTQKIANKDNIKEKKIVEKAEVVLTNKSISSSKTSKKEALISENDTDPIEADKANNTSTEVQNTSQDVEKKEILTDEIPIIKAVVTEHLQDSCIESKIIIDSHKNDCNRAVEAVIEDVVILNEEQEQVETNSLNEETKQNEINVKQSSDIKLKEVKTAEPHEIKSKKTENYVLKKHFDHEAAGESKKIRSIMESVLEKSVVILLEPLESIPRITRSRNENTKLKDSIKKEEKSKDKTFKNIDTNKNIKCGESSLERSEQNKIDKKENEDQSLEPIKTRRSRDLKSDATKSETIVKETSDISETNDLTKDPLPSNEKKSIDADSKRKIEKDVVELNRIRKSVELKSKVEEDKSKILNDNIGKEKCSAQRKTQNELTKDSLSSEEKKSIDADNESKMEKDIVDPNKTRRCGDLESKTEENKSKILNDNMGEEKCSAQRNTQNELTEDPLSSEEKKSIDADSKSKIEKDIVEPIRTRRHEDLKIKTEEEKTKISNDNMDEEKCSAQRKTQNELTEDPLPSDEKKSIEADSKNKIEKDIVEPNITKRSVDLESKTEENKSKILNDNMGEEKCSAQRNTHKELIKDPLPSDEKKSIDADSKSKIEKDIVEPIRTRRSVDHKSKTEEGKTKIISDNIVEGKCSGQRKTEHELTKDPLPSVEKKSIDADCKSNIEGDIVEPIRTRRSVDLKSKTEEGKNKIISDNIVEGKCSAQRKTQNELTKDPLPSVEKKSIETDTKTKIEKDIVEPIRTRRSEDLKSKTEEDKTKISNDNMDEEKRSAQRKTQNELTKDPLPSDGKKSIDSDSKNKIDKDAVEPIRTRRSVDHKSKTECKTKITSDNIVEGKCSAQRKTQHDLTKDPLPSVEKKSIDSDCKSNIERDIVEPIRTRRSGDHKSITEEDKTKTLNDNMGEEKCSAQRKTQEHLEVKKIKRSVGHKDESEIEKSEIPQGELSDKTNITQTEMEESKRKLRRREDLEVETNEKYYGKSSTPNEKKEHIETIKIGNIKEATNQEFSRTSHVKTLDDKNLTKIESKETNIEPMKTKARADLKDEAGKVEKELSENALSSEKKSTQKGTEEKFEQKKRRSRGDIKSGKLEAEIKQIIDKNYAAKKECDPLKRRTRGDVREEAIKDKVEILKIHSLGEKCSQKDSKEEPFEPMRKRRRGDITMETGKHKAELLHDERLGNESAKEHSAPIKNTKSSDSKRETIKVKSEVKQQENSEKIIIVPIRTRRHGDFKDEVEKGQKKATQVESTDEKIVDQKETTHNIDTITTKNLGDNKTESEKDTIEVHKAKSSEEKSLVQENSRNQTEEVQHFEPRITRSRADLREAVKEDDTPEKDLSQIQMSSENKTTSNISKNIEDIKMKNCKGAKQDSVHDKNQIFHEDSRHHTGEKFSEIIKTRRPAEELKQKVSNSIQSDESKILQDEKIISTADENKTEEITSKVSNNNQSSNSNIALKTNTDIEKISEESVLSENEMSGCESSSSNSDATFRRNLRKRGTDSPLSENDKNKKTFKEPLLKSPAHKNAKTEKAVTAVLISSSSKRPLRSLTLETESPGSTKKPKLETSKKSALFRNPHDGCLEKEELPIVKGEPIIISKEQHYLQKQPTVLDKHKLNESSAIVRKTTQSKEVKETSKNTVISEKKIEEKVEGAKTFETSIVQKEVDNENSKQQVREENLDVITKTNHNVKKATDLKEKKIENVTNIIIHPKTIKSNVKTTPNKLSGSSTVISFSDWLKGKNESTTSDIIDESATTKESTPELLKRQSRARVRLTPKNLDSNLNEDKETTGGISKRQTTMMCQDKEKVSVLEEMHEKTTALVEHNTLAVNVDQTDKSMNMSEQSDNSLLLTSETQIQNDINKDSVKSNKKVNVKRLNNKKSTIHLSLTKSHAPTTLSPKTKKSERELLIESMPKEMKDRGIKDLLETEVNVKRLRLPKRRNFGSDAPETRLAAAIVRLPKSNAPGVMSGSESPNVQEVSENMDIYTAAPSVRSISKSPTRRKPRQIAGQPRNCFTATADGTVSPDDPKAFAAKSRKSLYIKDSLQQIEKETTNSAIIGAIRSRKSTPPISKESMIKVANVPSKKLVAISKQLQFPKEQNASPKQEGLSLTALDKIPNAESIKKYPEDVKHSETRIRVKQTESLTKKFKCRKLHVRLNRSIVQTYLKSISNYENQILGRKRSVLKNASELPTNPADSLPIIQNNYETSLRIESVVDASTILSTASSTMMTDTQVSHPIAISNARTTQDTNIASTSITGMQRPYISTGVRETVAPLTTSIVNVADTNETFELKNEFMDENPIGLINDAILPDTPTLLARAQTITEAAQHALSNSVTPTDIRLLATDSSENNFVPSFGVTPRVLDNKGTCMYTFLHPAKYNRNHSNVLLDYCCPNLDGPMPAIDPTRIHAQVQVPVIEIPASIVLTTKVVTRGDLENENSSVPSIIRKKAEKIRKNMATHHKLAVATTTANTHATPLVPTVTQPHFTPTQRPSLPPTINALTKQLPATTTITAKIRPPISQNSPSDLSSNVVSSVASSLPKNTTVSVIHKCLSSQLTNVQQSSLRSNLRRFDVLLKQLVQPYESLSFVERHRIIEAIIASGKCLPKDLEQTLVLMEEYIKQTSLLKKNASLKQNASHETIMSTNNYTTSQQGIGSLLPAGRMPQLQPSPKILASNAAPVTATTYCTQLEQIHNSKVGKNSALSSATPPSSGGVLIKQRQVPIYDTDRNIIGYQMQTMTPMSSVPAYTKSTMSSHTGAIMSTSLDSTNNKMTTYNKRAVKRPAQDSPRVFYTTPPLKTSTPKSILTPDIYPAQHTKNENTIAQKTQGSIVTTVRSGGSSSTGNSETITTTTMATVKRVTRSTATGSKIIIVSKSNQSSEETILPDSQQQTEIAEIKNEKDIEDFLD